MMRLEVMLYLAILAWNVYSISVKNMVISLSHSSKDSITGTKDKSKKEKSTDREEDQEKKGFKICRQSTMGEHFPS